MAVNGTTVAAVRLLVIIVVVGGGVQAEVFLKGLNCLTLNFTLGG